MSTSIHSRLGQLFVLETKSGRWSARIGELLRSVRPSGVVVPLSPGPSEAPLAAYIKGVRSALDQSSLVGLADPQFGVIDSLLSLRRPQPIFNPGLRRQAESWGKWMGALLRGFGLNVDFSLRLDLTGPAFRAAGRARDPQVVAQCARAYLRGLAPSKVIACVCNFPGIGSAEPDREFGGLLSSKPMAVLWREDLLPFREALPVLPLVMVSHAGYKAYDFETPRPGIWSSEILTGLLRVKLGYKGVAVANLSDLADTAKDIDLGGAVVKALEAGCDLFVVPGTKFSVTSVRRSLRAALDSGRITPGRVEQSLRRIRVLKRKLAKPLRVVSKRTLEQLSRQIRTRAVRTGENEDSV